MSDTPTPEDRLLDGLEDPHVLLKMLTSADTGPTHEQLRQLLSVDSHNEISSHVADTLLGDSPGIDDLRSVIMYAPSHASEAGPQLVEMTSNPDDLDFVVQYCTYEPAREAAAEKLLDGSPNEDQLVNIVCFVPLHRNDAAIAVLEMSPTDDHLRSIIQHVDMRSIRDEASGKLLKGDPTNVDLHYIIGFENTHSVTAAQQLLEKDGLHADDLLIIVNYIDGAPAETAWNYLTSSDAYELAPTQLATIVTDRPTFAQRALDLLLAMDDSAEALETIVRSSASSQYQLSAAERLLYLGPSGTVLDLIKSRVPSLTAQVDALLRLPQDERRAAMSVGATAIFSRLSAVLQQA